MIISVDAEKPFNKILSHLLIKTLNMLVIEDTERLHMKSPQVTSFSTVEN